MRKTTGCARLLLIHCALGFVLMFPLGMIFDVMNWPLFHGWALAHGSFILAWPMLTLLSFGAWHGVRWLEKHATTKRPVKG